MLMRDPAAWAVAPASDAPAAVMIWVTPDVPAAVDAPDAAPAALAVADAVAVAVAWLDVAPAACATALPVAADVADPADEPAATRIAAPAACACAAPPAAPFADTVLTVTGVAAGKADIIVMTNDGLFVATCSVTVS